MGRFPLPFCSSSRCHDISEAKRVFASDGTYEYRAGAMRDHEKHSDKASCLVLTWLVEQGKVARGQRSTVRTGSHGRWYLLVLPSTFQQRATVSFPLCFLFVKEVPYLSSHGAF